MLAFHWSRRTLLGSAISATLALTGQASGQDVSAQGAAASPQPMVAGNAMNNPFRMLENWPHLGDIKPCQRSRETA